MGHHRRFAGISLAVLLAGCGGGDPLPGDVPPADTGARDTGAPRTDTGTPVVVDDTGSTEEDTGAPVIDSGVEGDSTTPPADTSIADTTVSDTTVGDTAVSDAPGEAGVTSGTRIYTGAVTLRGVTSDNYAIITDSSGAAFAVPLAGGAAQSIGTGVERVRVSGKTVFVWGAINATYNFGTLRVWTAANGTKSISGKALAPSTTTVAGLFVAAANPDGTLIAYTDNFVESASGDDKADLVVAKADGTGVKKVFSQYVMYDSTLGGSCAPFLFWVGSRFVTTHCTPGATANSFDLSSIDATAGTSTSLGTDLKTYYANNDGGTMVGFVAGSTNQLRIVPVAGGTTVNVDTDVSSMVFSHDGSFVVYRTSGSALKRSAISAASPLTLVASGAGGLLTGTSPNDKFILISSAAPTSSGSDVKLASVTAAGTPTVLYSATNGEVYGNGFTSDSSHALFYGSVVSPGVGTLTATPTAGGGNIVLGSAAWQDYAAGSAKIVWNDTHVTVGSGGRATIRSKDLGSATSATTTLAESADRTFVLDASLAKVVYTVSTGGASDGLWVASVP